VASTTTSGSGPASATAAAIANGSFATRVASLSPLALMSTTTNTGVSTAKSYWEYLGYGSFANVRNVTVPVAVSVFPDELYQAPRSWTEKAYSNLVHFNEVDRGGHFAAWEQPELYASELRAGFRSLR
jgi:pimeloyl-ACP methyl ester carboxylesterase